MTEDTAGEPRVEFGRILFAADWSRAANESLISDEEYVNRLLRHVETENRRTVPGSSGGVREAG